MTDTTKDFERWARLGFGPWLLPIIPPLVALTPQTQIKPEARGKAVGLRGVSGQWYGYGGWHGKVATAEDRAAWGAMGAGVGIQCGVYVGADADITDSAAAAAVDKLTLEILGPGVPRVGRAPKLLRLYVAAAGEHIVKQRLEFTLPDSDVVHAVEILGHGQQFVAEGTHPVTMRPYAWPEGLPTQIDIPTVTLAQVSRWLDAVAQAVAEMGGEVTARNRFGAWAEERGAVDQAALAAPSDELLAEALARVPNEGDRDAWIRMGHAIKAAGGTEEQWAEWSDRWDGPAEDPEDIARRWAGFRPPFAVGWPHIERAAREAGWYGGVEADFVRAGLDLAALAAAAEAEAAEPPPWEAAGLTIQDRMFLRHVWVKEFDRIGDLAARELLTRGQFNVQLAEIGPPHDSRKCAWAQFVADKDRCRHVASTTYRPGGPLLVTENLTQKHGLCMNTWRPSTLVPRRGVTDEDVAPFLRLAEALLPDPIERGHLLDWMAARLQRRGVKPRFGVVLGGFQGIGKDSLFLPLIRALGLHNVREIRVAHVESEFNGWAGESELVIIGEMHSFARREMSDRLKDMLTSPPDSIAINQKNLPLHHAPNLFALLMFTNHLDALSIEDSDRRLLALWSPRPNPRRLPPAERAALKREFKAYHEDFLDKGGDEAVAGWLLARDIRAHLALSDAPDTSAKADMARAGRSEATASIEDALEAMDLPDLVNPEDVAARMGTGVRAGKNGPSGHAVARVLRSMGAEMVTDHAVAVPPTAIVTGAKRIRIWALRDAAGYRAMRPVTLARKFAEMWAATKQDIEAFFAPHLAAESTVEKSRSVEV